MLAAKNGDDVFAARYKAHCPPRVHGAAGRVVRREDPGELGDQSVSAEPPALDYHCSDQWLSPTKASQCAWTPCEEKRDPLPK